MAVKVILIFTLVIHLSRFAKIEGGNRKLSREEDFEIEKELKRLRKHTLKTIKIENGDTYDCVDFYKQPAFNNPLLMNHSYHFQMRPNFHNSKRMTKTDALTFKQCTWIGLKDKPCPIGTVPIRRRTKEDVIRAKLFEERYYGLKSRISPRTFGQFYALARTKSSVKANYHGAGATLSVYNPKVNALANEYSSTQITLKNGLDTIQVGWTVNPDLYNDTSTRLFTSFEGILGSCFNTRCPGFVIVNTQVSLDTSFEPITRRGYLPLYEFHLFVQQDTSGNWWLQFGQNLDNNMEIGFWPRKLFSSGGGLADFATYADWGGSAFGNTPEMGNGHMPIGDTKYDAYCRLVTVMNEARHFVDADVEVYTNYFKNYSLIDIGLHGESGRAVVFGGPADE